ncbi:sterol esterase [Malassezia vespertilionis]|uniref:sterol esterase n=1 Tax=Malassezia vespertilionis TaxID=2020962 RepID=UPI0024B19A0E|nr:sterol esterase [Malassezia vespertilionis]WFD06276.1 sterol esterase [Malassezia vespertilionis]
MSSRPISSRKRNYNQTPALAVEQEADDEGPFADARQVEQDWDARDASTIGRPSGEYADAPDEAGSVHNAPTVFDDARAAPSTYEPSTYEEPSMYEEYDDAPGMSYTNSTSFSEDYPTYGEQTAYDRGSQDTLPQRRSAFIEKPYTEGRDAEKYVDSKEYGYHFDPRYPEAEDEQHPGGFPAFFHHSVGDYGEFNIFSRLYLEIRQLCMFGVTSIALLFVGNLAYFRYFNPFKHSPPKARTDSEFERRITGERLSERVEYYAQYWGYVCEEYEIETAGGWLLKAHRISDPRRPGGRGYPVVLQHGILCSSLFFFTNEERSLGFWLVDQGFDVWSTNIRSNMGAGHVRFKRWDPRFWAWGMMELADDLVDVVQYVLGVTGSSQLAYVGHSQGTASMFLALSHGKYPELGNKLSSFTALGPAVFPGPSLNRFPFRVMQLFKSRWSWSLAFGVRDFIPAITLARSLVPAWLFGHMAYVIFGYLFDFHDHNWVDRLKPKMFRATGIPTSSELLYYYMQSFVLRGCVFNPTVRTPWFPRSFPPLTVAYGSTDNLVLGKPLIDRLLKHESNVEIVHIIELQGYEHMDMVMGVDAYKTVFPKIKDTILRTMDLEDVPASNTM